jgi:aryl-alcohol dehydrogenase-like predicted oxidoreductase
MVEAAVAEGSRVLENVKLGVGTWSWGDRLFWGYGNEYQLSDVQDAFRTSLRNGINFFDTAETYGQGNSESMLGGFIREAGQSVVVATKFMPFPWRLSHGAFQRALAHSLQRLGLQSVDIYQMHQPTPPVRIETWMASMAEAYQQGLIRFVGVSNYDRSQTQQAYDALTREGISLATNQVEYNLLDRRIEKSGLMQHCMDLDVKVIAYSPLAMGVLTGKYSPGHPPAGFRSRRYSRALLARTQRLIDELKKIGSSHGGKNAAQVALNWVICKGAIPIPGAKTAQQAESNAGALGWRLNDAEIQRLDQLSDFVLKED